MSYTKILSDYVATLNYDMLPENTVENAKKLILHVVSAALAAKDVPQAKAAVNIVKSKSGIPEAQVWGTKGLKVPMDEAAFANGTMADILDWEDCAWTGHPSAGAVPVALACGKAKGSTGKEIITAIVAAYDVYQRIAMSIQPKPEDWGKPEHPWGLTCWQSFAGTIPAAKLLGLDSKEIMTCIGVSTHQTSLPGATRDGSDIYHYAHGICARNGINNAIITKAGVDPIRDALDGPSGFWRQIQDEVDWSWYDKDLGEHFFVDDTLLKHWPTNMWIQGPLDALDEIYQGYQFGIDDVEKIEVTPDVGLYSEELTYPTTMMKAEFNLAYGFAAFLDNPIASADWYNEKNLNNKKYYDFSEKVIFSEIKKNPLEQFMVFWTGDFPECSVKVTLKDGTVLEKACHFPKGHPKNAFTWEEEEKRFMEISKMPQEQSKAIVDFVKNLENMDKIDELDDMLA